jgi:hypothetical protein
MGGAPRAQSDAGRRVLVLGGYGAFGARVAERLARLSGIELVIAGRSRGKAEAFALRLTQRTGAQAIPAVLDGARMTAGDLEQRKPAVLINASGPFQAQDYTVASACIAAGVHYVDLADAGAFVNGIGALDAGARQAGVLAVSGASTVPALSGAVADRFAAEFARLERIETVIAPGNRFDPGLATTRSILSGLGQPIPGGAKSRTVRGWQGLRRRALPGLGARWIGHCDAPDRELFPRRYAGLREADVFAALEIGPFHLGLWVLSGLARIGILRRPERLAGPLLALKTWAGVLGSDRGGMLVTLEGVGHDGRRKRVGWHLVAGSGHGPYIPGTPAVLLTKALLEGSLAARGAMPCAGLFTLDAFLSEIRDLDITTGTA